MKTFSKISIILTIHLLAVSILTADGLIHDLIDDEYENITSRTSIDYDTKIVQAWHDSSWVNKSQTVKIYDGNGDLSQKDYYKYIDGEWELKGITVNENNESGLPLTTTKQLYRNETWRNRYRAGFSYNDDGFLSQKMESKWVHNGWRNRKKTELVYEGELCINRAISKWRDSTWVNRAVVDLSYNDASDRAEKITYKWNEGTLTPIHKVVYNYNENASISEKLFFKWFDSTWVNKARASVVYDDTDNPVQTMLEKMDSTGSWMNVSIKEMTYANGNQLAETVQSKWFNGAWIPRKRFEYIYPTMREGALSISGNTVFPKSITLSKAYPNPFNPVTTINYHLSEPTHIQLEIYDMVGRKISTLVNSEQSVGSWSTHWNATNDLGQPVAAGVYLYTIEAGRETISRKIVLLK